MVTGFQVASLGGYRFPGWMAKVVTCLHVGLRRWLQVSVMARLGWLQVSRLDDEYDYRFVAWLAELCIRNKHNCKRTDICSRSVVYF